MISMTRYNVLSLLFKFYNLFLNFNTLDSHLNYFLMNIVICICFFYLVFL